MEDFPPDPNRGFDFPSPIFIFEGKVYMGSNSLVFIPLPDLSMPFNVITLTGTLVAFMIGSMINKMIRKSEWENKEKLSIWKKVINKIKRKKSDKFKPE